MSRHKRTPKQLRTQQWMEEANYEAKRIMADEQERNAAQVRLNVTSNKLYTALVKEYFKAIQAKGEG